MLDAGDTDDLAVVNLLVGGTKVISKQMLALKVLEGTWWDAEGQPQVMQNNE